DVVLHLRFEDGNLIGRQFAEWRETFHNAGLSRFLHRHRLTLLGFLSDESLRALNDIVIDLVEDLLPLLFNGVAFFVLGVLIVLRFIAIVGFTGLIGWLRRFIVFRTRRAFL